MKKQLIVLALMVCSVLPMFATTVRLINASDKTLEVRYNIGDTFELAFVGAKEEAEITTDQLFSYFTVKLLVQANDADLKDFADEVNKLMKDNTYVSLKITADSVTEASTIDKMYACFTKAKEALVESAKAVRDKFVTDESEFAGVRLCVSEASLCTCMEVN